MSDEMIIKIPLKPNTIHKYTLQITRSQTIQMPLDATIISVNIQHGILCIWAAVNDEASFEGRWFEIRGTGWALDGNEGQFLSTVITDDGSYVWHVFERVKKY